MVNFPGYIYICISEFDVQKAQSETMELEKQSHRETVVQMYQF